MEIYTVFLFLNVATLLDNMEIIRGGPDSLIPVGVGLVELWASGEVDHGEEQDETGQRESYPTGASTTHWYGQTWNKHQVVRNSNQKQTRL